MRNLIFSLILSLFFIAGAIAQDKNEVKGPKHKNYKPWKNTPTQKVIVSSDRTSQKGLEAKNFKLWEAAKKDLEDQKIVSTKVDGDRLKGPKAKNAKPWNN